MHLSEIAKLVGRSDLSNKDTIEVGVKAGWLYRPAHPSKGYRVTDAGKKLGGRESYKKADDRYDVVFEDCQEIRDELQRQ
jgi:hypothetical protein